jgi:hypothetical protein
MSLKKLFEKKVRKIKNFIFFDNFHKIKTHFLSYLNQRKSVKILSHFLDDVFEHCQFVRSVLIPAGINKATLKCDMHNDGRHLCISAQSEAAEARKIPINVQQTEQQKTQIKVKFEIDH